jgi:hypothetical protein
MSTPTNPSPGKRPRRAEPLIAIGTHVTYKFHAWVQAFAREEGVTISSLIAKSLASYARRSMFREPPIHRSRKRGS